MKNILLIFFLLLSIFQIQAQQEPYVPGLIVVKFKAQSQKGSSSFLLNEELLKGDKRIKKINKVISAKALQKRGEDESILSGIYKVDLLESVDEESYINYLKSFSNVQYAEPYPNVYPLYVPNDPESKIGMAQAYLEQIKAYLSWDITQGDATKIIGIIDTGVDLEHEDLKGNLYLNTADPIDGVDNDGDGYTDNYYGWDFADDNNNPQADGSPHGTGVAGIAAAATDNGTGMAGVGFDTKFMPIKIFKSETNFSRNSFEAIVYAADMGCDVVNLSWGNTGRYSQYAQDIINYAVLENDVVVIAAAGNTNAELNYFPASYDNVTSVGFVNQNDEKDPNATYSDFIDIVAPGVSIYTTQNNDTYARDGGSSYAAPMVAGAAALVRAVHPEWNALQVMEQLRVNSDDIYEVGNNSDYQYKFGKGRLNIFKSLADFDDPAIRISDVQFTNGLEQAAYFGDTLDITLQFTNYLAATENVEITLTSESEFVTILNSHFTISSLGNFEEISNSTTPFKVILSEDLPENEAINFRVLMEGEFYSDYQSFQIQSSPKIRIFDFNGWHFGFTATGNLGRSYETPFDNYVLQYNGVELLEHFGVAIVNAADSISQNTAIQPNFFNYLEDFESVERLKRYNDNTADLDIRSVFKEQDTLSSQTGLYVRQRLLGWDSDGEEPILLLKYDIMNRGDQHLDSLYFQLLADWAVEGQSSNRIRYDSATQMSYAYDEAENNFVGLAILDNHDSTFYALDFASDNGHTSDLMNDSLTNELLWSYTHNAFGKISAGDLSTGNNIAGLQGIRLADFPSGASAELSIALLAGNNLQDLKNLVEQAKVRNHSIKLNPPLGKQVFLCLNDAPQVTAPDKSIYKIYDSVFSDTPIFEGQLFEPGVLQNDTTFYYEEVDSLGFSSYRKSMPFTIVKPKANFELIDQPFLLTPNKTNSYYFQDLSENAVAWNWSFGNGYESTKKNPKISFNEEGSFEVQLIVENYIGCKDTITHTFETAWRAITPQISSVEICKNDQLSIEDASLSEIVIYSDSLATDQIFKGASFLTEPLKQDTIFYVRNEVGDYPSEILKVNVTIVPIKASMQLRTDINSSIDSMVVVAKSISSYAEQIIWLIGEEEIGNENEVYFNPMRLDENQLKLVAVSQSGCSDTTVFNPSPSPEPEFPNYSLCKNSDLLIEAANSSSVYFFADSTLDEYLGKGKSITIVDVTVNSMVYAVNVEAIYPSEIIEVPMYVSELSAEFSMSKDTLNLAFDSEITLIAQSDAANSWGWEFGNGLKSTHQEVIAQYDSPGIYTIQLTTEDSLGCSESTSKTLVVFDDPLLGNRNELRKFFSIFPNPANQFIHLKGEGDFSYESLKIMDMQGQELFSKKNNKPTQQAEVISTSALQNGSYYLVVKKGKNEAAFIFIINR
ncbi:S8 family serine peptidase [Marivirga sp. S37H4]|uniref:S8 family serine peptidase n=1 Tax=Marivirga aurantiaca TaxID=2802615 RepID=A0A934WWF5_9BACT|nr:S8 family serine peptidase [Marivirga aurantiaca]MBK6264187.1 S8 family serine peptidase [Marivirga aurantiaca]